MRGNPNTSLGWASGFAVALALNVSSCSGPQEWQGWLYPDGADLDRSVPLGRFESLEQCRATAQEALFVLTRYEGGSYECCRGCERRADLGGIFVCDETAD